MELKLIWGGIQDVSADAIIVNLFEGVASPSGAAAVVDQALSGAISEMIANGDLSGKLGEVSVLYPHGAMPAKRVLVVGLGKREKFDLEASRKAAGAAVRRGRELNARSIATIVHGGGIGTLPIGASAQATVEGSLLALYEYKEFKHDEEEQKKVVETLNIVEFDATKLAEIEAGMKVAEALAAGVFIARDLVNMPPNVATPTRMAETAQEIAAAHRLKVFVGDREWAASQKMGAFLSVGKGAGEPPKFIVLEYNGDRKNLDTVILVGKGITFDSGGISIKPSEHMEEMKSDMAGAAAVLGAMKVVGMLNLPLRVIGIAPCTENMPDGTAYHPADIITASNGKTIEIISTDAEGRMILADALVYAQQYEPKAVVDLATLTGACVVALGNSIAAGIFCNDEKLQEKLVASGKQTHERLWPLPLWDDYKKSIKSNVADMKNSGGRYSGVGSSAVFLREFVDYPWAHLDIAPMALADKGNEYIPDGGVGFGVRLLVDFLRNW